MAEQVGMKFGDFLISAGLIDNWQLRLGMRSQRQSGSRIGEALVAGHFLSEEQMVEALSRHLGFPWLNLQGSDAQYRIGDGPVLACVPSELAREFLVFPVGFHYGESGRELILATTDPGNADLLAELGCLLNAPLRPVLATKASILDAISMFYGDDDDPGEAARLPVPRVAPFFKVLRRPSVANS